MNRHSTARVLRAGLPALFLLGLGIQTSAGWIVFRNNQQTHGEPGNVLGPSGYMWPWLATLGQLVAFAALAALLAWQAGQSRARQDAELRQTLRRVEARLAELSRPPDPTPAEAGHVPAARPVEPGGASPRPAGRGDGSSP
jgi:hypothetical protein